MDPSRPSATIVVVFEKRPRWTPELQRRFEDEPVHVRGCHSAGEMPEIVDDVRVACVVLSLEEAEGECLHVLGQLASRHADKPVIAIGSDRSAGLEWPFRELGAAEFLSGTFTAADVARTCRRRLARAPRFAPTA